MKKIMIILSIMLSLVLWGCGLSHKEHKVIEEEIEVLVRQKDIFYEYNLDITDIEIIKQQTNVDEKEDFVFVCVKGQNEDFIAIRNFKITYVLYNDGWKYESIDLYSNENYNNETIPLHGVNADTLEDAFESNDTFMVQGFNEATFYQGQIEKVESDTYREVYKQIKKYEYDFFSDSIEMLAVCEWRDTYWDIQMEYHNTLSLNESIYGEYIASTYNETFGMGKEIYLNLFEQSGVSYYDIEYMEQTRAWGTSTKSFEDICELSYFEANELANLTGLSGKCVLLNSNDEFTIAIFPSGIYFGNIKLERC